MTLLVICAIAAIIVLLEDFTEMISNVMGTITLILHFTRMCFVIPLILWPLVNRSRSIKLCNSAIDIQIRLYDRLNPNEPIKHVGFTLLKAQTILNILVLVMNCGFFIYNFYMFPQVRKLQLVVIHYGFALIEFLISVHHVNTQIWAIFIARQLKEMVRHTKSIRQDALRSIIALSSDLDDFKKLFGSIFGPMQIVHVLNVFVMCSVQSYVAIYCLVPAIVASGERFPTMSHLTVLNIFNHLCTSVVYVDASQKEVTARRKHVLRNILPIACLIMMFAYLGSVKSLRDFNLMMQSVMEIVHLIKYCINGQIICYVVVWMYRYSGDVVRLYQDMIEMDNALQRLRPAIGFETDHHGPMKMLIALAILLRAAISAYHLVTLSTDDTPVSIDVMLILQGNVVVELILDLDKIYLVFFAIYLNKRYVCIEQMVRTNDAVQLVGTFEAFGRLLTVKERISQTLGQPMLFMVLETFVACSVHAYLLMFFAGTNAKTLLHVLANAGQLAIHFLLFYILTHFYDAVERKEAELRSALKSIQYINFKQQTGEQKDFYDLINLKLMMEPPKITACGLFEINLQIFYNVFAAIITYIVILFQFRGFEKAP
ncbi:AGAP006143-PE-like protein [Anopheles sinensis]|uniref:Gustatory receptor n=1 Tax=Anopheles sinensis TaxID=74873 RepID=A0A084WEQ4_ANOSI|nr:AGAP006143-PE-like protein [Anopheles sinensis]